MNFLFFDRKNTRSGAGALTWGGLNSIFFRYFRHYLGRLLSSTVTFTNRLKVRPSHLLHIKVLMRAVLTPRDRKGTLGPSLELHHMFLHVLIIYFEIFLINMVI